MRKTDQFYVTVSRINEAAHQEPYETFTGHTLSVSQDGTLSITWDGGCKLLSGGLWDGFDVRVMPQR
jgi:hypothetical protein